VAKNIILYVVFLPLPVLLGFLFFSGNTWFPVMIGETGLILTLAGGGLLNYATEGRQKRYIKNAFSQYLSPAVIEQLIANPERLKLGGERRTLSIFFSDLQGFTSISEGLSPEELTSLLNNYLSAMTDIIQEEEGTIDKYEGDAIIAFWNAPLDLDDHAVRCVRAALRCQQELARLRPVFRKQVGKELHMRIGINTGPAVVGNMGSHSRFDYTMFGDTVNLAARLEGVNKQFGTFTMISENTRVTIEESDGQQFGYRELARVAVVGRSEPVTVYEPMLTEEYRQKKQQVEAFHQALSMFYEGAFEEARQAFEKLAGQDPAAEAYAGKCGELQENPSESWKGVWVMTSK
jgi:adenylate cyclase